MHKKRDEPEIQSDAERRLSSVLPLDAARNEGRFYGQIIRGRPLNGVQRVGFFLVGFLFCFFAIFLFAAAFPNLAGAVGLSSPATATASALFYVPFAMISLLVGLAAIGKSLGRRRQRRHERAG